MSFALREQEIDKELGSVHVCGMIAGKFSEMDTERAMKSADKPEDVKKSLEAWDI